MWIRLRFSDEHQCWLLRDHGDARPLLTRLNSRRVNYSSFWSTELESPPAQSGLFFEQEHKQMTPKDHDFSSATIVNWDYLQQQGIIRGHTRNEVEIEWDKIKAILQHDPSPFSKEDISPSEKELKNKQLREVKQLCQHLLNFPYKYNDLGYKTDISDLKDRFGEMILAHGVEEAKGGIHNLVLMALGNCVNANFWGALVDGPSDVSPVPHGPYYIIGATPLGCDESQLEDAVPPKHLDTVEYILFPAPEEKFYFECYMKRALELNMITHEYMQIIMGKCVTYEELRLKLTNHIIETQQAAPSTPDADELGNVSTPESSPRK